MSDLKEKFKSIVSENIKRKGIDEFMAFLDGTDFYTSPASTMFHCSYEGGLLEHSLNVYKLLSSVKWLEEKYSKETIALVSLFHDVCKADTYIVSTRNVKNDKTGIWEKQPFYKFDDSFPYGHGEKSVYLLQRFMELSDEEALAINWHMGGFDSRNSGTHLASNAMNYSPLVVELHIADLRATYLVENKKDSQK